MYSSLDVDARVFVNYIIVVCWLSHRKPYPALRSRYGFAMCQSFVVECSKTVRSDRNNVGHVVFYVLSEHASLSV
jgi:hypothetical protein